MAKLNIFLADESYYDRMLALEHFVSSRHAYKQEIRNEENSSHFTFQRIRLPREVYLAYPRDMDDLVPHWQAADLVFVGMVEDHLLGYMVLDVHHLPKTVRVCDLVVVNDARRNGIATAMLAVCETWATTNKYNRILLDIPLRNDPMVRLAQKLGYAMSGFMDQYFPNHDPAVFFEKRMS
jgi:GNAT superfamily N-acetyltransferase